MKKAKLIFIILLSLFAMAQAATPGCLELPIGLRRDFGYASGTGKIQGTFTISASGPTDLKRVIFYLDGHPMGDIQQAPFSLRFSTDSYGLGEHTFSALGYTSSGRKLESNSITAVFVTAKEGWEAGLKILVPLLSLVFGVTLIMIVATVFSSGLTGKKLMDLPLGAERHYGIAGGAICPRCKRPFSRHLLSPNMVVGKLERCPYCGKVSVVAARSMAALHAAEAAELAAVGAPPASSASPDEQLHKDLDDSRYQDL
jgi:DNA-directed RNA polymerase subunit RPC12/RpoP